MLKDQKWLTRVLWLTNLNPKERQYTHNNNEFCKCLISHVIWIYRKCEIHDVTQISYED